MEQAEETPRPPRRQRALLDPVPPNIAGYRVDGVLGQGGTGIVLRVHDEVLDRPLALKLLADELDDDARARFMVEARAAGRIIHPNVVQVFAVGSFEGRTFITQELVDGHPLSSLLEVRGKLSSAAVIDIGIQAARGLERAAEVGVVHRDVKPQNLLVTDEGLVKLADFGIAKLLHSPSVLTETGTALGTPHYMSPEQGLAEEIDARSDQYSLGATLYHLVTGRAPFDSDNALALLLKHVQEPLPPVHAIEPECPRALAEVIEKMLAKKRDDRYASFDEVATALENAQVGETESDTGDVKELVSITSEKRARYEKTPPPAIEDPIVEAATRQAVTPPPKEVKSAPELVIVMGAVIVALAVVIVALVEKGESKKTGPVSPAAVHAPAPEPVRAPDPVPALDPVPAPLAAKREEREEEKKSHEEPGKKQKELPVAGDTPHEAPRTRAGGADRLTALVRALAKDPASAERAARELAEAGDQSAVPALIALLEKNEGERASVAAAETLGVLGDLRAIDPLREAADSAKSPKIRAAAKRALERLFKVEEGAGVVE